jgi:integrase
MPKLTDLKIRSLKPDPAKRREIPDGNGLYLVIQPSGSKGWALRYRLLGKSQKLTLGGWFAGDIKHAPEPKIDGLLTLKGARALAAAEKLKIDEKDHDPAAAKRHAKDEQDRRRENTFRAVAEAYMLQRSILPTLGGMPIAEIRKSDVIKLRNKLADGELRDQQGRKIKGGPVAADHALAVIRKIFSWHALMSDDDFRSPVIPGLNLVKVGLRARDRVLTDDELRVIWQTASHLEGPFPALVRFLLLTGARRSEAAGLRWEEVDDAGDWELPAERNKVKVKLLRPLSQAAQDVLAAQPRIAGSKFAFTIDGRGAISGFSKHKKKFDAAVLRQLKKQDPKAEAFPDFVLHDLRRTARTLLSRAGVQPDHAARCLGHTIGGVRGIYDRHEYRDEKKLAFEALARKIADIVEPPPANVLPFSTTANNKG